MRTRVSMGDLPSNLQMEILSRLPIKTMIHCKCVCKAWLSLVSEPEFVKLHLCRSPTSLVINWMYGSDNPEVLQLINLEDMTNRPDFRSETCMIFDHSSINDQLVLLGSRNGLILLNSLADDSLYIWNPITTEYITLPRAEGERRYPNLVAHGFGYSSRSDQYKVIRIYQEATTDPVSGSFTSCKSEWQVYTLGSGAWRSAGHVNYSFGCRLHGVQLNGNLHWLVDDNEGHALISSFDLDRESSQSLLLPHGLENQTWKTLGVLDGRLCICNNATDSDLEVWVMKEYGVTKSWNKEFVINEGEYWLSYVCVYALTVLENGEVLFLWSDHTLFSYNIERKTTQEYVLSEGNFEANVDVLSFFRLKNFEAEEVKKLQWKKQPRDIGKKRGGINHVPQSTC